MMVYNYISILTILHLNCVPIINIGQYIIYNYCWNIKITSLNLI